MKITLDDTNSGYNVAVINSNFQLIEDELNTKVLYRDNPIGEPNAMSDDLDMNGNRLYNLPAPTLASEAARLQDVQDSINWTFSTAVAAASVANNTVFRDAADNKLKFKDNSGVVNALY